MRGDDWTSGVRTKRTVDVFSTSIDDTHTIFSDPRVLFHRTGRNNEQSSKMFTAFVRSNRSSRCLHVPLDIWYEIFAYLDSLDLLQLARSCKDLRSLLLNKTSTWVWEKARSRTLTPPHVDPPPKCPEWLDEPAYADLLFDNHCYRCRRDCRQVESPSQPVIWQFRARYCEMCRPIECVTMVYPNDLLMRQIPLPTPKKVLCTFQERTLGRSSTLFHAPDISKFVKNIQEALEDYSDKAREQHIAELSAAEVARTQNIMQNYPLYSGWQHSMGSFRRKETMKRIARRGDDIIARLIALGWDADFLRDWNVLGALRKDLHFSKREELTDTVWEEIRDPIVSHITQLKSKYDVRFRREILYKRFCQFHALVPGIFGRVAAPHIRPRTVDLVLIPEIRAILDQPNDVTITLENFEPIKEHIADITRRWRASAKSQLLRTIRSAEATMGNTIRKHIDPFELARTHFRCEDCYQIFSSTTVLQHGCQTYYYHSFTDNLLKVYENTAREVGSNLPWRADKFSWIACAKATDPIIRAFGLDTQVSKPKDMDSMDVRVACSLCETKNRSRIVMQWRTAMHHALQVHPKDYGDLVWQVLNAAEVACSKRLEVETRKALTQKRAILTRWVCAQCPPNTPFGSMWCRSSPEALIEHNKTQHHIEAPTKGWNYYPLPLHLLVPEPVILLDDRLPPSKLRKEEKDMLERGVAGYVNRRIDA